MDRIDLLFGTSEKPYVSAYLQARARSIVSRCAIRDLLDLERIDFLRDTGTIEEVRALYHGL